MKEIEVAFDALTEMAKETSKIIGEFVEAIDSLPRYVAYEMAHPRKKPRGSIRRARKGNKNDNMDASNHG